MRAQENVNIACARRVDRRTTLRWLAAAIAISRVPQHALADALNPSPRSGSKGYGTDPDLNHPVVPWSRSMTAHQLQVTAVLSDLILPASDIAPAPSALGIPDFVDEWVSAPYPEQRSDRTVILEGLEWIDAQARRHWQAGFLQLESSQQRQLLDMTVADAEGGRRAFFARFRFIVVGAYYTTPEGFKDIGYIGNVPLASYPPITDQEKSILDSELQSLGIPTDVTR